MCTNFFVDPQIMQQLEMTLSLVDYIPGNRSTKSHTVCTSAYKVEATYVHRSIKSHSRTTLCLVPYYL